MGGSSYSGATYARTVGSTVKTRGAAAAFVHTASIRSGTSDEKVHKDLDVSIPNKAGIKTRESRDSVSQPNSHGVVTLLDVTGSMGEIPKVIVSKLSTLMAALVKKGFIPEPHVLFGAVGDATCDKVPLQMGQFESDNTIDDVLTKIHLEGGGGGQNTESYELGMYYIDKYVQMDCFEKRGIKGYLFIIGDELPYPKVKASEVKQHIGDSLQDGAEVERLIESLREKFNLFWILPKGSHNYSNKTVVDRLKVLFGQSLILLESPEDIVEKICLTIGVCEGYDINEAIDSLVDTGLSRSALNKASTDLAVFKGTGTVARAKVGGTIVTVGADSVSTL